MTIYYIDPHTTVNGTGTWASPWSLASTTRTGLASGDEIRIKGVALTSLLTATSYTATYAAQNAMTITEGGSLGADFPVGTIAYFPAYDVFARVTAVAANTLTFGAGVMPWYNTTAGQTSIVIRKVDSTTYPAGSGGTNTYIFSDASTSRDNITVSDCWTSETTRVTDGRVKTLVYNSAATATITATLNTISGANPTGCTYNLNNTHILGGSGSGAGGVTLRLFGTNITATIKQVCSQTNNAAVIAISTTGFRSKNITLTINDLCSYYGIGGSGNSVDGLTINVTNLSAYQADNLLGNSASSFWYAENVTVNITNIVGFTQVQSAVVFTSNFSAKNLQLNLNGIVDIYQSGAPSYIIFTNNAGQIEVSFGASFVLYRNRRGSTITTASVGVQLGSPPNMNCYVPTLSVPPGWTTPATPYSILGYFSSPYLNMTPFKNNPSIYRISTPTTPPDATLIALGTGSINTLLVPRDGSNPVEYLSTNGSNNNVAANNLPKVTTDETVYNTAAPSLKSYLTTWVAEQWRNTNAVKNIKIPVVSGTSYTVTGYICTDDTTYVNGDCFVSIELNGAQLVAQNMTTSCINAWEQFTLTFTASQTCEVNLVWGMLYRNGAKSYWLSDLEIS